jgi:small conductance mechanosensitive channel
VNFYLHVLGWTLGIAIGAGIFIWILSRVLRRIARLAGARRATDRSIRDGLLLLWAVVTVGTFLYVSDLATTFSILTVSGVAGLVVSLALQATLTNMIMGIFLLSDRLISVGDVIDYSNGSLRGRVVRVALRNTWILNEQGQISVLNNSTLAAGPLINLTKSSSFARELAEETLLKTVPPKPLAASAPAPSAPAAATATATPPQAR